MGPRLGSWPLGRMDGWLAGQALRGRWAGSVWQGLSSYPVVEEAAHRCGVGKWVRGWVGLQPSHCQWLAALSITDLATGWQRLASQPPTIVNHPQRSAFIHPPTNLPTHHSALLWGTSEASARKGRKDAVPMDASHPHTHSISTKQVCHQPRNSSHAHRTHQANQTAIDTPNPHRAGGLVNNQ
jgi:hypothetical protein